MFKLLSVNVSLPKKIQHKGKTVTTGIFKEPIKGKVTARTLNLDGDGQADLIGHGGEMRAIYVYSHDNYGYWQEELGRDTFPLGQFGENFTVERMPDQEVHVGDQFRIGSALFEVSQPRVPCYKLAIKMEVEDFYSRILKSGRLGFYFRVLEEGEVQAGDDIVLVKSHPAQMNISEMNALMYFDKQNYNGFREALKVKALSPGWKATFEDRLAKEKHEIKDQKSYRTFIVKDKVTESSTIASFYLTPEDGEPIDNYLPGQFLPIKLDIPGQYQQVNRTYTISNSPGSTHYRLTIKREMAPSDIPNAYPGVSSNYFHNQVAIGSKISGSRPRGKFYLNTEHDRPVVLLSAGVGITPMVSMLESLVNHNSSRKIWFIHGARNGKEHAMGSHVRKLVQQLEEANFFIIYSKPMIEDIQYRDYEDKGHVKIALIERLIASKDCDFYLCGPTAFMKGLFEGLTNWGVPVTNIYYEFFGPASKMGDLKSIAQSKRKAEVSECCNDVEIHFSKSGIRANWNPSFDSILDLAEAEGLNPDFSCRSGICQTCACNLNSGEVAYAPEPLQEPEKGTVLICCSKPQSNLEIEL